MTNEKDYMIKTSDFTDLDEIFTGPRVDYDQIVEDEIDGVESDIALWNPDSCDRGSNDDDDTDEYEGDGYLETDVSDVDGSHLVWKLASFIVDHLRDMNVTIQEDLVLNGKCGCFDVSVEELELRVDSSGFFAVIRFNDDDWELINSAGSIPDLQEYNEMIRWSLHLVGWLKRRIKGDFGM